MISEPNKFLSTDVFVLAELNAQEKNMEESYWKCEEQRKWGSISARII